MGCSPVPPRQAVAGGQDGTSVGTSVEEAIGAPWAGDRAATDGPVTGSYGVPGRRGGGGEGMDPVGSDDVSLLTGCGHLGGTMPGGVGYAASGPESMQEAINRGGVHAQDVGYRLWMVTGLESTDGSLPHGVWQSWHRCTGSVKCDRANFDREFIGPRVGLSARAPSFFRTAHVTRPHMVVTKQIQACFSLCQHFTERESLQNSEAQHVLCLPFMLESQS